MTDSIFDEAVGLVLDLEGWKTTDTGGRTVCGISEKAHPDAVAKMWDMTYEPAREYASQIYRGQYWNPLLHYCVERGYIDTNFIHVNVERFLIAAFDSAVNCGLPWAQYQISEMEPGLCSMLKLERLLWKRVYYYLALAQKSKYKKYLPGWISRLKKVREFCFEKK